MSAQTEKSTMQRIGDNFRAAAGLPERKGDGPVTNGTAAPSEAKLATEPEGGYGGKGGISNSGVLTSQEAASLERAKERAQDTEADAKGEELSAKSGSGQVTNDERSTSTKATRKAADKPAKKTAKRAAKKA